MARPVYPYELSDPDFCWLINHFEENNPNYFMVQDGALPVVYVREYQNETLMDEEPQFLLDHPGQNNERDTK